MFNIVKLREFMLGRPAQTRQDAEKLLAEKYGRDHIVVEAGEPPSNLLCPISNRDCHCACRERTVRSDGAGQAGRCADAGVEAASVQSARRGRCRLDGAGHR
jgi:hypothetical protein